jgi:voltage-gated potassium channel Kch
MMLYQRFVVPRLGAREQRAADGIRESNPVIIAGFGRFGQVVTRVLRGLGIDATVIDHDPAQIETVRRYGWKAYYGDATRMDLLESAGVAHARLLVVAIDNPIAAMQMVKRLRRRFPGLQLIVRAHSRTDAFEYTELGVPVVREVFASALEATSKLLVALGYEPDNAQRIIERFREYDERQIAESAPHRHDIKKLIALTEQGRRDIAQLLASEAASAPQTEEQAEARAT